MQGRWRWAPPSTHLLALASCAAGLTMMVSTALLCTGHDVCGDVRLYAPDRSRRQVIGVRWRPGESSFNLALRGKMPV